MTLEELIDAALGNTKAEAIVKGGSLINVFTGEVYKADISIYGGRIISTGDSTKYVGADTKVINANELFLSPGFIDGHLHFEVSKLSFTMLSKLLVPCGTTSIISGLDETFSVFGEAGIDSTIAESKASPLRLYFGVPSKLPYTIPSSTLRYEVDANVLERQLPKEYTYGIWETVTEFITNKDVDVLTGLARAKELHKHAFGCLPLARGSILNAAIAAGIRLDHESYTPEEMLEKVRNGLYVMIRESTVTHFLEKNIEVISRYGIPSGRVGFCTDDVLSYDVLKRGHLDNVVRMAIGKGIPPIEAYQMATINTAIMYLIDDEVGVIAPGRFADLVFLSDMQNVKVKGVMTNGSLVIWDGGFVSKVVPPTRESWMLDTFNVKEVVRASRIRVEAPIKTGGALVIGVKVRDSNPFRRTGEEFRTKVVDGEALADVEQDLLYVTVVERHKRTGLMATAFVTGFNLKYGAMASSAAPDDNNIIAVGASKEDLALAINQVIDMKGGQVVTSKGTVKKTIALPIGGILADADPTEMAKEELGLDELSHEIGSKLASPMNSMIFLPVTAIPDYAMTDKGLVDCKRLEIISPIVECN